MKQLAILLFLLMVMCGCTSAKPLPDDVQFDETNCSILCSGIGARSLGVVYNGGAAIACVCGRPAKRVALEQRRWKPSISY